MIDRNHRINVVCPHCGKQFHEPIGSLEEFGAYRCDCGSLLECNLNELAEFVREKAADKSAYFTLSPHEKGP